MLDRDLIFGVLAVQAGFVTASEVLAAAAEGGAGKGPDSLLTQLQRRGALSGERRKALEELGEQALAARNGDVHAAAASLGGGTLLATLVLQLRGDSAAEVPLERPGQYTRLQELGRGSQSVVRAARDEFVGREVALKELVPLPVPEKDESSRAAQARFLREVRLVASLDHPGIVSILELARREDGTLFCAQKLIRGETLQARLASCRTLEERLALVRHVLDACQAMGFAHSRNVIHRDLKPSNIMVGEFGETVVVDWGLARHREEPEDVVPLVATPPGTGLTLAGEALGTPDYMSPEQARGDLPSIDAPSDVFSLGAILYELLTGRPPFVGTTPEHVLENAVAGTVHPVRTLEARAPPELAAIAERALRAEPRERYRDAEELAKELSAYLGGGRVRAYQYGAWERLRKFAASHRALSGGLAVAFGALLVTALVVGIRLQATRRDLARSFIERAHAAERESDWGSAATYFAAARVQQDTPEARWGLALAEERAAERVLSLEGPPNSFTDVGLLPDERMVILSRARNHVEVRELESGRKLWSRDEDGISGSALFPGGQVGLSVPGGWGYFDGATGKPLQMFDRERGRPCRGPYPTPVTVRGGKLIAWRADAAPLILAEDVTPVGAECAVSSDGGLTAYQDSSGSVHLFSLPDGRRVADRPAGGLVNLVFTRHGLVLVRQGSLEILGGPDGDFSIGLSETGLAIGLGWPLESVSPDGHLIVVPRPGTSRADVVDLRARMIRGSLHYPSGRPRFAFSPDGERVFAAGLGHGSRLVGWRLPANDAPRAHPGLWRLDLADFSPSGRQVVMVDQARRALEIFDERGERLGSHPVSDPSGDLFVHDGLVLWSEDRADELLLRDFQQEQTLWTRHSRRPSSYDVSADGSRVLKTDLAGLEVWDARLDRVLFAETRRLSGFQSFGALSPDGRSVAWTEERKVHLRDLESGREGEFPVGGSDAHPRFSPDSRRLAVVSSERLLVVDAGTLRVLSDVPHARPDRPYGLRWSADGGYLLVEYESLGSELFDAHDGSQLARFPAGGPERVMVSPDLRTKLVFNTTSWNLRPLPRPAVDTPAESLQRTLRKTGLALTGVEVVAAP